ncbi:hypothetical protein [Xanthomonas sacchari]|uniref:hypothetical protein n=1 Tax=Xanthomonas sacchari TaxID=56458 RepID=UPI002434F435|nr:hypothetical protein [Xanthomonas sacchari]
MLYEEAVQMLDLTLRGFSLQRLFLYAVEQAQNAERVMQERRPENEVELQGGVVARVSAVHAILDDNGAAVFQVQAHPTETDPSHAMVLSGLPKSRLLKFRKSLVACFAALTPITELCGAGKTS